MKDRMEIESKELGKHIGACTGKDVEGNKCTFTLLAESDKKCPRCGTKVKK